MAVRAGPCSIEGCCYPRRARGLCSTHYRKLRVHGDPFYRPPVESRSRLRRDLTGQRFGRLTVLERITDGKANVRWRCRCDCGKETVAITGNLMNGHHKSCGCYRGGPTAYKAKKTTVVGGYVFLKDFSHPRANKKTGRVREHIVVMERMLGRYLLPGEEVHHKNSDRADNKEGNLELWTKSHPAGGRVEDKVAWAVDLLKLYAPERLTSTTP